MCQDCGCEQGNARAYFETERDGGHAEGVASHDHHDHHHGASGGQPSQVHIHIHLPPGLISPVPQVHIHPHAEHGHAHPHSHSHEHGHAHPHDAQEKTAGGETEELEASPKDQAARSIVIESRVLARNDAFAERNRTWLEERGVVAINFISSPGSGKTYLLEKTLEGLAARKISCAVIAGDQQTDNDARRLQGKGARVVQIETKSSCHLNAEQVGGFLGEVVCDGVKLLFIENVGNLVCPAAFDLGEQLKIALLSVTEGEDKPLKYPVIFHDAPVSVVTKIDLLEHLDVDLDTCRESIRKVRPDAKIVELSAKTGAGMPDWLDYLESLVK